MGNLGTRSEAHDIAEVGLSASDVAELQRKFKFDGPEACRQLIESKIEDWKTIALNVAVIGNSGVGKSSFINAIRGLTADNEGAADVGVTETTTGISDYPHPNNPMLKFWDLPGVGTDRFPKNGYLEAIQFDKYDFFLLMTATRFTENDTWLGQEITKTQRKFFFVRTKLGVDIHNDRQTHRRTHNELSVITKIRDNIRTHLHAHDKEDAPIFLVDSTKPHQFDFEKLEQRLIQEFAVAKRPALIMSLSAYSKEMVRLKVAELRSRMWTAAALSRSNGTATAAVPIHGAPELLDMDIVLEETQFYAKQLGMDNASLRNYAELMMVDYNDLKAIVDKAVGPNFLTVEWINNLLKMLRRATTETTSHAAPMMGLIQLLFPFLPFTATPMSFSTSSTITTYATTYAVFSDILQLLEEVALQVVTYATEHCGICDEDDGD